ncbi:MAG TPA: hypothetical protein ENK66_08710 [Arcobacter sp.]|jgi:hypothetical protein|nr:hypothetical protein [Arcobacter sp.]
MKNISIVIVLLIVICLGFLQYKKIKKDELIQKININIQTQGSRCEMNNEKPIEIKIKNNTNKIIVKSYITYSTFEDMSKMYGEYKSLDVVVDSTIKPDESYTLCVKPPLKKSFFILTQKAMEKDGEKIKINFPHAKVGFNIYNSEFHHKINKKDFDFK